MKIISLFAFISLTIGCSSEEKVSKKVFQEITLVNNIEFNNSKFNQPKFSCGFLIKYKADTFAITAKHLLKIIRPDEMKSVVFDNVVKNWSLYPLASKNEMVVADKLLNKNKAELLEDKSTYENDWLIFSLRKNNSKVKPLEIRTSALAPREKLYVVGWTRKMESGPQRVYEFEYYKTIGNRILLKDLVVPEQFGGLSGAPLVDENGQVVGIVSNGTVDPESNKKYFSPCALAGVLAFLESRSAGK